MQNNFETRMHSSRMRTVRNSSRLLEGASPGGGLLPAGCLLLGGQGVPTPGGYLLRGWLLLGGGGIPACTEADPLCGQTDRCRNIAFATSLRTVIRKQVLQ